MKIYTSETVISNEEIDEKKLYQSYLDMISNSKIDIFISGNIKNPKKVIQVIKDNFKFNSNNHLKDPQIIYNNKLSKPIIKKEVKKYQLALIRLAGKQTVNNLNVAQFDLTTQNIDKKDLNYEKQNLDVSTPQGETKWRN